MIMNASIARQSVATSLMCVLVGSAVDARADDLTKEQCVEANENAQALRQGGKLRAARAQLLICLANSCPGPVRDDCGEQLVALERAAPTVVFAAEGPAGNTLSAVQVTMDGTRLADHLDGSALVVDPGEHVFALVADGYTSVSKKLVIREGMKGRKEVVRFQSTMLPLEPEPVPVASPVGAAKPEPPRSKSSAGGQRAVAYVLGSAGIFSGIVGAYFGLRAKSTYDDAISFSNCPKGLSSCNQTGVDGDNSAHSQATISTIAFVTGGALLAAGVVLLLTAPKDRAVSVQPSVGASSAGIKLGGGW